jgi:hypothetical protein
LLKVQLVLPQEVNYVRQDHLLFGIFPVSVAACLLSFSPSLAVDFPSVLWTTLPEQMLQYLSLLILGSVP